MLVTAWNNGAHHKNGAGYGLKVDALDRNRYFSRSWQTIILELPGQTDLVEINVAKASSWGNTCRELISREIGNGYWIMNTLHGSEDNLPNFILIRSVSGVLSSAQNETCFFAVYFTNFPCE